MVTPNNVVSVGAQHAIQDMVELEMYLLAQPQRTPWPLLPRSTKRPQDARTPYTHTVDFTVANELLVRGFIEATSNRTFVVSKSGHEFHDREVKLHSASVPQDRI